MQLLQISHREVKAVAICNSLPALIREWKKKGRNCRKRGQIGSPERICLCKLHICPVSGPHKRSSALASGRGKTVPAPFILLDTARGTAANLLTFFFCGGEKSKEKEKKKRKEKSKASKPRTGWEMSFQMPVLGVYAHPIFSAKSLSVDLN